MTPNWTERVIKQISASLKWSLSLRKHDWELADYPVFTREQEDNSEGSTGRLKQHRYIAYVVNWGLAGSGDTRKEAISDLATKFGAAKVERSRQGKHLPRPGARVPVELACRERVMAHPVLADDFIQRVLNLDWEWISDDSSLWDFHAQETNESLCTRIKEVYGVDVSDIESAKLADIFDRIAAIRR